MEQTTETFDIQKASSAQRELVKNKNYPHFAPGDGRCYNCNQQIFEEKDRGPGTRKTGISVESAGKSLITGCPHCQRSYCD